jgi:hypothetical protein
MSSLIGSITLSPIAGGTQPHPGVLPALPPSPVLVEGEPRPGTVSAPEADACALPSRQGVQASVGTYQSRLIFRWAEGLGVSLVPVAYRRLRRRYGDEQSAMNYAMCRSATDIRGVVGWQVRRVGSRIWRTFEPFNIDCGAFVRTGEIG